MLKSYFSTKENTFQRKLSLLSAVNALQTCLQRSKVTHVHTQSGRTLIQLPLFG